MAEAVRIVTVRMPAYIHTWLVDYAARGGESVNAAIVRLVDQEMVATEHERTINSA